MIHAWNKALIQSASGVFERGGSQRAPEINEEQMKDLHSKIGELAVANGTGAFAAPPGPRSP